MGGCCCCFPRDNEVSNTTTHNHLQYPSAEEHVPLSHWRPSSVASTELLEDAITNPDASEVSTGRQPPGLVMFDTGSGQQSHHRSPVISSNKSSGAQETTFSDSAQGTIDGTAVRVSDVIEEKELSKTETEHNPVSTKEQELELSKTAESFFPDTEEDDCPICLDEYDLENPKMVTLCNHHFHLSCILEWMERSEACPVCDQELILLDF